MRASKITLIGTLVLGLQAVCSGTAHASAVTFAYELFYLTPLTERLTILVLATAAGVLCYVRLWRGSDEGRR